MNYKNIFKHIHSKGFTGVLGMEHGNSKPGKEGEMAVIKAYPMQAITSEPVPDEWFEAAWWEREIDSVLALPDPRLCNLRITLAHYQLSLALRALTGTDAGANFHTWAVWGSKKAGETIRREDTRGFCRTVHIVSGSCGVGVAAASALGLLPLLPAVGGVALGCLVGLGPGACLRQTLGRTARHILSGNRTVLEDIGRATGRFVAAFRGRSVPDPDRLETFLDTLPTEGPGLLRKAFTQYHAAAAETDPDRKLERMYLANLYAILHEHLRLEPYIDASMPPPFRRWITSRLLDYCIGSEALRVAQDIAMRDATAAPFPPALTTLGDPELRAFLEGPEGWDRTPGSLAGSSARDWTCLQDRMNYIVDLFRTRHLNPALFTAPFTPDQCAAITAGHTPPPPL